MADRPIIFSAPMIRALLDGRKTQTRRVLCQFDPDRDPPHAGPYIAGHKAATWTDREGTPWRYPGAKGAATGDRLYVREAFVTGFNIADETDKPVGDRKVWHRATDAGLTWYDPDGESTLDNPPWKPSIHMPRWASRLTLTVTDVRVQRLQDISEADAVAEGSTMRANCSGFMSREQGWSMDWSQVGQLSAHATGATRTAKAPLTEVDISLSDPQMAFASYFNSLHGPDAWDANPWVVVLTFTVQRGNIDQFEGDA